MSNLSKTTARLIAACVLTLGSALSANAANVTLSQLACGQHNVSQTVETGDWSYGNLTTADTGTCSNGVTTFEGSALGVQLTSDSAFSTSALDMNNRQHVGTDGIGQFSFSLTTMSGFTDANIAITVNALMSYEIDLDSQETDYYAGAAAYGRVVGRLRINGGNVDTFSLGHNSYSAPNSSTNGPNATHGAFSITGTDLLTGTQVLSATDTQFSISLITSGTVNAAAGTQAATSSASASASTYASVFLQNIELPDGVCIQEQYDRYSACGAAIAAAVPLPASGLLLLGGLAGVGVMRRKRVS